jgi:biopolymer transport protein ExbD
MAAKISGGGGGRYTIAQNADINVTPFVDIMLVLLIIFMVSIPPPSASIKLDMPPATNTPIKAKDPTFIQILTDGKMLITTGSLSETTTLETLPAMLNARLLADNPSTADTRELVVYVKAEPDVEYEKFMDLLNSMQDAGYLKIGLINEDIT